MTSKTATSLALVLIGVGVVLRLGFLGADSLWLDEAYSVVVVLEHSTREAWETVLDRDHPPLFFVILRLTVLAFGASETTARLPSALASVCNLGLIFVLARRLGMTKRAGLSAVLLLALAPVDIWYAQEARMYALVTTAALLFAIGLAMESPAGAVLAGVALAAGLYTDFTMVPLSAALTAVWLVRWWHLGRPPWQLARVIVATSVAWWSYRPQWTHLWEVLARIDTVPLFVNLREAGIRLSPGRPAVVVVTLMVIGTLIATAAMWNALGNRRVRTWWTWIAWAGFVGCTALVMIPRAYSVKQFMSTGWPFVILVVVWSLTDGGREEARQYPAARLARLRLPLAAGLSLIAAIVTVAAPRADWRGSVAYLNARAASRPEPGTLSVWLDPVVELHSLRLLRSEDRRRRRPVRCCQPNRWLAAMPPRPMCAWSLNDSGNRRQPLRAKPGSISTSAWLTWFRLRGSNCAATRIAGRRPKRSPGAAEDENAADPVVVSGLQAGRVGPTCKHLHLYVVSDLQADRDHGRLKPDTTYM